MSHKHYQGSNLAQISNKTVSDRLKAIERLFIFIDKKLFWSCPVKCQLSFMINLHRSKLNSR